MCEHRLACRMDIGVGLTAVKKIDQRPVAGPGFIAFEQPCNRVRRHLVASQHAPQINLICVLLTGSCRTIRVAIP